MPTLRLTKTTVANLPDSRKPILYFDTKSIGFGVRVCGSTKTYIVQCRIVGRYNSKGRPLEIRVSIGRTGIISFDEAQDKAKEILNDAAKGITLADRERQARRAGKAQEDIITINTILPLYVLARKKIKQSTVDEYRWFLNKYIPDWLDLPLEEIDGTMVYKKHQELGAKFPATADKVCAILRALYGFATIMYEDRIVKNPVGKLKALGAWYRPKRRKGYVENVTPDRATEEGNRAIEMERC